MKTKFLAVLIIGVIASITITALSQEVPHYTIEVRLDTERHVLEGHQIVRYYNDSQGPLRYVFFHLFPNLGREKNPYLDPSYIDVTYWSGFDPSWIEIKGVFKKDGEEWLKLSYTLIEAPSIIQTYSLKDGILKVELPKELPPGGDVTLKMDFVTKFPHVLVGDQGRYGGTYTWRFGWNPVAIPAKNLIGGEYISQQKPYYKYELPSAFYEVFLTVPGDLEVAGGAWQEVIEEFEEGNRQRKTVRLYSEVPMRSLPLSVGPYLKYVLEYKIPIEVYYFPGYEASARLFATYAADALKFFERWGKYSYKRLLIVQSPARGLFGMGADATIFLGRSFFSEKDIGVEGFLDRLCDYIIAHEVAHLWWGIGVGTDFNAENFLSEAFAEYFAITYFEEKYGEFGPNLFQLEQKGLLQGLVMSQFGFMNLREHQTELPYLQVFRQRFDEAIIKPWQEVKYGNFTTVRIYNKGYLVLRNVEGLLGEEIMDKILLEAHKRFNHKIMTVQDLKEIAEEVSQQDLDQFFHDWLYEDPPGFVDYAVSKVEVEPQEQGFLNKIHLKRRGDIVMPVKVVLVPKEGDKIEMIWRAERREEVLEVTTNHPIKRVEVDPQSMVLDINRLNNYYPMKLRVITTGENDFPLDAYLIRFNPAIGVIEGGFLLDHYWMIGQNGGVVAVNLGRGASWDLMLEFTEGGLAFEWGLNLTGYKTPHIGYTATFWEGSDLLRISAGRDFKFYYLGIDYRKISLLTKTHLSWLSLRLTPQAVRAEIGGLEKKRLLPHTCLEGMAKIGVLHGSNPPESLRFGLGLSSFGQAWGWVSLGAKASLTLPLYREISYSIADLAMVHRLDQTYYIAAAGVWEGIDQVDIAELKAEAGFELTLSGTTLGGLLPFTLKVGFAYPLTEGGGQVQYIQAQIPL